MANNPADDSIPANLTQDANTMANNLSDDSSPDNLTQDTNTVANNPSDDSNPDNLTQDTNMMANNPSNKDPADNLTQDTNMMAKHVGFFDRNKDGVVYPWETYQGLRALGFGTLISLFTAIGVNVVLSPLTRKGKFPSPLFGIHLKNIAACKHGSDSGVYDENGNFVQAKFDEIFSKHAHLNPNGLNFLEVQLMLNANRNDIIGAIAAIGEWNLLYFLGKDKNGLLTKETVKGIFDGTFLTQIENERKQQPTK